MKLYVEIVATVSVVFACVGIAGKPLQADPLQTPGATPATDMSTLSLPTTAAPNSPGSTPTGPSATPNVKPPDTVDDTDPGWTWKNMEMYSDPVLYGKSAHTGPPGSYGQISFHGTGVKIYGVGGPSVPLDGVMHTMGTAIVWVDGKQVAETPVNLPNTRYRYVIASVDGLTDSDHILLMEPRDGWVTLDYIEVTHNPPGAQTAALISMPDDSNQPVYQIIPKEPNTANLCFGNSGVQDTCFIWSPTNGRTQFWHITPLPGGGDMITPVGHPDDALCIDPRGAPTADYPRGMPTESYLLPYAGRPDQQIVITNQNDGFYKLSPSTDTNLCLSVFRAALTDGTPVTGSFWKDAPNQEWQLQLQQPSAH
jgi:hypothetical protein